MDKNAMSVLIFRLRTHPIVFCFLLSEVALTSDTSEDILLSSVRGFNSLFIPLFYPYMNMLLAYHLATKYTNG